MLLLDLHFAATDTTANTILSGILYLATHRDIQGEPLSPPRPAQCFSQQLANDANDAQYVPLTTYFMPH